MEVFYGFLVRTKVEKEELESILDVIVGERCEYFVGQVIHPQSLEGFSVTFVGRPKPGIVYNPASIHNYLSEFRVKLKEALHQQEKEEEQNA